MRQTFAISGVTCNACKFVIEKRLKAIRGVQEVIVNVQTGEASTTSDRKIEAIELTNALTDTHYKVITNS